MASRLYFIAGDIFSNILVGITAGGVSWLLIDVGWNMWLAMFVAMALGMVVAGILFFPLSVLFGAMEVMVPTMWSGMVSGMVIGMWCAMTPVMMIEAVVGGGVCGLLGWAVVMLYDRALRGPVRFEERV